MTEVLHRTCSVSFKIAIYVQGGKIKACSVHAATHATSSSHRQIPFILFVWYKVQA